MKSNVSHLTGPEIQPQPTLQVGDLITFGRDGERGTGLVINYRVARGHPYPHRSVGARRCLVKILWWPLQPGADGAPRRCPPGTKLWMDVKADNIKKARSNQ